jgi:GH43 family beta-xylosidase
MSCNKLAFLLILSICILSAAHADDGVGRNGSIAGLFQNPIREGRWPDPYCYLHTDGFYYMPLSENNGITLFKSAILHNWRDAQSARVFAPPEGLTSLWAPEIFFLGGNWYMYFALDDGNNRNHRMYVSRAVDPNNPFGAWTAARRYLTKYYRIFSKYMQKYIFFCTKDCQCLEKMYGQLMELCWSIQMDASILFGQDGQQLMQNFLKIYTLLQCQTQVKISEIVIMLDFYLILL